MISKKQRQIYEYIEEFINKHAYSPSLEEIKRHFRLSSVSTIHHHILNLEKEGLIKKEKNEPRSIELKKTKKDLAKIPLMGIIAAGEPIEAITEKEIIEVSKSQLSSSGTHYALRVRGNSMLDEGIYNGDMVIIREQPTADNGDTVVALINNNEVTLKKIYKENNRFRLQPANPSLKPIYTKELVIQGKVVSVIRHFEETKEANQPSNYATLPKENTLHLQDIKKY